MAKTVISSGSLCIFLVLLSASLNSVGVVISHLKKLIKMTFFFFFISKFLKDNVFKLYKFLGDAALL